MPILIATTAIPASLLEHEEFIKTAVRIARSERGHAQSLVQEIDQMFAVLHECLDTKPVLTLPTDLMGYPQAEDMARIVSIQLQCTRLTGAGVEHVPFVKCTELATHWSLYTRAATGLAEWVEDFHIDSKSSGQAYSNAIHAAAKLSMQHQAFIEQIQ